MIFWKNYEGHRTEIINEYDNTIYTFDIETSTYLILGRKQLKPLDYLKLTEEEKENTIAQSLCYIWQFSINDTVYYGRTLEDFVLFLQRLDYYTGYVNKIVYVHNLGYEFTYLRNVLNFKSVFARKSRKVMKAILEDFNVEFRCSLYLSQVKLERLPSVYQLDCQKQVGLLDYNLPRSPFTELSENELKYCEYDCLVLYEYIKLMKSKFGTVKSIPLTSTGIVRRELKAELAKDKKYKYVVRNCLNTEGEIYDVLVSSFYGGYTHANFLYTGDIIKNVTSYDFCSSYPFVLCTEKYPMSKFRKCKIDNHTQFSSRFCYIVDITFYNIDSKYFNNIISKSSCYSGDKIQTDNGRIIKAKEISTIITDIDFELIRKAYKYDYYIINECYYARKDYLPKTIVEFILKKYVDKTKLKNVEGKEVLYQITKR